MLFPKKISKQFWTVVPRRWITWSEAIDPRYIHLCLPLLKAFCYFVEPPSFPRMPWSIPFMTGLCFAPDKGTMTFSPISLNLSDFRDIIKPGILSSVPTHAKQHFFHSKEDFFGQGVLRHMEVDMGAYLPPMYLWFLQLPKERLCKWHHTHSFSLLFFPALIHH